MYPRARFWNHYNSSLTQKNASLVFKRHNIHHHLFADDKQAYANVSLHGIDHVRGRLRNCITDISNWCASRRLQLNENKTELDWFGKRSHLIKLADMEQMLTVGTNVIQSAAVVRDLSVLSCVLTARGQRRIAARRAADRAVSRSPRGEPKVDNMDFVLSVHTARLTARRRAKTLSKSKSSRL